VYSFTPLSFAYPLLCTIAGSRGKDWKAFREGRAEEERNREAGRMNRDILADEEMAKQGFHQVLKGEGEGRRGERSDGD
jgi:hypothetical protein